MLQSTINRTNGLTDEILLVICNEQHRFIVEEQLRQLNRLNGNILLVIHIPSHLKSTRLLKMGKLSFQQFGRLYLLLDVVSRSGGPPVMSITGQVFIKKRMRAEDAVYGGEMSAHDLAFADWRFNLCSSNTEPVVRLNVESRGDVPLMEARTQAILGGLNQ